MNKRILCFFCFFCFKNSSINTAQEPDFDPTVLGVRAGCFSSSSRPRCGARNTGSQNGWKSSQHQGLIKGRRSNQLSRHGMHKAFPISLQGFCASFKFNSRSDLFLDSFSFLHREEMSISFEFGLVHEHQSSCLQVLSYYPPRERTPIKERNL